MAGEKLPPFFVGDSACWGAMRIRNYHRTPKTFPWGKGDRREAVVDEGVTSERSHPAQPEQTRQHRKLRFLDFASEIQTLIRLGFAEPPSPKGRFLGEGTPIGASVCWGCGGGIGFGPMWASAPTYWRRHVPVPQIGFSPAFLIRPSGPPSPRGKGSSYCFLLLGCDGGIGVGPMWSSAPTAWLGSAVVCGGLWAILESPLRRGWGAGFSFLIRNF